MINIRETATVAGLAIILTAGVFFYIGWYKWEHRPPQTVNNIQQISGDNATVTQATDKPKDRRLLIGAYGNQKQIGALVGWLW